jgi:hypothetical protein
VPTSTPPFLLTRLAVLLFLQFFVWGAWYLTAYRFMIAHEMAYNAFYLYTAGPLGAILAPFILGLCVDRFFNAERVLAACFLGAGAVMLLLPWVGGLPGQPVYLQGSPGEAREVAYYTVQFLGSPVPKSTLFNLMILLHMLFYMPTLGLTATLAFRHLPQGGARFPLVRLWGTLGWIAAGLVLALGFTRSAADGRLIEAGETAVQFQLSAAAALALALFCLTLPRTPPPRRGEPFSARELLFIDAWKELRNPAFAVYTLCSFLICIPLAAYYANLSNQLGAMNLSHASIWANVGTWLEAGMLFMMPWFLARLGVKRMILIAMAAWIARYALFSWSAGQGALPAPFLDGGAPNPAYPGMIILGLPVPCLHFGFLLMLLGVALHGLCYDFFFVTGQVYVERVTRPEIRGQAQAMNIFFTQGLGLYFGALAAGWISLAAFQDGHGHVVLATSPAALPLWPKLWWPLAAMAAAVLVLFALAFRYREPKAAPAA